MMKCLSPIVFVMLLSACAGTTGGSSGADTSGTSGGTTEGSAGSSKPSSTGTRYLYACFKDQSGQRQIALWLQFTVVQTRGV